MCCMVMANRPGRLPLIGGQQTQTICVTFVQRRPSVFDAGPTLYKRYTNVLCLLGGRCNVHLCQLAAYYALEQPENCSYFRKWKVRLPSGITHSKKMEALSYSFAGMR